MNVCVCNSENKKSILISDLEKTKVLHFVFRQVCNQFTYLAVQILESVCVTLA